MSAMQQYIQEADRQVRVYGTSPVTTASSAVQSKNINGGGMNANDTSQNGGYPQQQQQQEPPPPPPPTSRGLAAIPLLCAAASEQRVSYLRRIQTTSYHNAWWKRQEPLLAPPFTVLAIPEHILLFLATSVETISLYVTYTHVTNEASSTGLPDRKSTRLNSSHVD